MPKSQERFWIIQDGQLGTAVKTPQGGQTNFIPAKIVPRSAVGYTVAMRAGNDQKCFDYEIGDSFVDIDNWFCQEFRCAIARTIIIKFAGQSTNPIDIHESDPIAVEVDEDLRFELQEAYTRRFYSI